MKMFCKVDRRIVMTSLQDKADLFANLPKPKLVQSERWVRVKFGGKFIADSKQPLLVLQYGPGVLPTYYFF